MTVSDHGQHNGGKVEGAREFPLWPSLVRFVLDNYDFHHTIVLRRDVVLLHECVFDIYICGKWSVMDIICSYNRIKSRDLLNR